MTDTQRRYAVGARVRIQNPDLPEDGFIVCVSEWLPECGLYWVVLDVGPEMLGEYREDELAEHCP